MSSIFLSAPVQKINSQIAATAGVELYVLRLDLMHPQVNGNKWFKLKYNLLEAQEKNFATIITFGGAYSNHIFATAAAGKIFRFRTIGVIRGEETLPLNPTLSFALEQGMQLVYCDRTTYRQRHTTQLQEELKQRFGEVFIIPEGGCNLNGVRGCTEIMQISELFDTICLACGTATTLAGIALSLHSKQKIIGFPVLKGGEFLAAEIESLINNYLTSSLPAPFDHPAPWQLVCNYHFGGYAKVNQELIMFCQKFTQEHNIPLDYVYTGKMFYGVMNLLQQGFFTPGRLLLIHTGGLQGNLGINEKLLKKIFN
ncbi:1-aminocyclopropane-1-carboxylate deaminase/D-cysteine desulfhydrase [Sphaerospermopsis aphanizomenoides BCCUSP55]|uniref:1-aminocyclopropane-1-carboxylate deaminase/D-cysteine desulfhydrase n=1 Tax=Sphaerospermopsis aphanizomenoides TaxID=459663 RepID=UPI000A5AFD11|nr:pyridoxal-phosphate dependent enzyme [Sphaerospermopsis aphanizomenoides]MBK1989986.1 1-aminocyclopropane-1-carboxylate deaminase/D-cysteine desulfhydrase [Sphaerospermopsis aphanizomenoides BCCUSP55]